MVKKISFKVNYTLGLTLQELGYGTRCIAETAWLEVRQQGCPDLWLRNKIWFLGKIYLVLLHCILCMGFPTSKLGGAPASPPNF